MKDFEVYVDLFNELGSGHYDFDFMKLFLTYRTHLDTATRRVSEIMNCYTPEMHGNILRWIRIYCKYFHRLIKSEPGMADLLKTKVSFKVEGQSYLFNIHQMLSASPHTYEKNMEYMRNLTMFGPEYANAQLRRHPMSLFNHPMFDSDSQSQNVPWGIRSRDLLITGWSGVFSGLNNVFFW